MVFNSLTFCLFLGLVLAVDRVLPTWRARNGALLVASYLFYAAWNPPFVALLWLSTVVDWHAAKRLYAARSRGAKRAWLLVSLGTNLGLLGFFKYGEFALVNTAAALGAVGVQWAPPELGVVLPVGISFYTFQTLSYTIDVYRGNARPWESALDFALFVTFFPQLVAGPIVRAVDFLPQCVAPRRADMDQLGWGLALLVVGLFQKTVLADTLLAPISDRVFDAAGRAGTLDAWGGTLAFAGQIFFDFAGYSTCAIGVALCLGFALPDNFRFPYAAVGFSDFWRRWHISLSTWLRDYLYIPLGGNRRGPLRTQWNLAWTMLLGGLWHGASWTFVVWGALHGAYLVVERALRSVVQLPAACERGLGRWLLALATFLAVCVTWIFFRARTLADAGALLRSTVTGARSDLLGAQDLGVVGVLTAGLLAGHWLLRDRSLEQAWGLLPWWGRSALLSVLIFGICLTGGDERAFLYFQF